MPGSEELARSALEFLQTSCDQYGNTDLEQERRLKHSTISLHMGIELILKARLAQEHWTLVLLSPDRYRQGDWERGAFQSVPLRDVLARLSEVCDINISQQAETAFTDLAELRNKFVHFACDDSAERVTGIQLRAWHYFMDLLDHEFLSMAAEQNHVLQDIKARMLRRDEFLAARFEEVRDSIAERVGAGSRVITCPFCSHPALSVGDGATCLVCGSIRSETREYAEEYARRLAPWMSSDEYYNTQWAALCSDCGQQACVVAPDELKAECEETLLKNAGIEHENEMDIEPWYCFNCGTVYDSLDIVECTRCGKLFGRAQDESLCPHCSW